MANTDPTTHPGSRSALIVAPMAGGPSTVELVAQAAAAGAFGFLAGGYLPVGRLSEQIDQLRSISPHPFGVNLFVPSPPRPEIAQAARDFGARLRPMAELAGVELGAPVWDDDRYGDKVDLLVAAAPSVVSFTFGWPAHDDVARLQASGVQVWVTLNDPSEVEWANQLGVDGIVAQGWQAGGHRGGPVDTGHGLPTRDLVTAVNELRHSGVHLVAAGGAMTSGDIRALLARGADAVACGTAYLNATEAGTAWVHRHALTHREATVVTRTFTGRSARALRTTWTDLHSAGAPAAYPYVHHLTAPLRAFGKATGQPELVHLWAGTGHARARSLPAAQITTELLSAVD